MVFTNDDILGMNRGQLQTECSKAGLSSVGSPDQLVQRLRFWLSNQNNSGGTRRPQETTGHVVSHQKNSVADDLICPITLELPFDPVMAEDGRVYEREAIEQHIKTKGNGQLKSPFTNQEMGGNLITATQIKNTIETLIEAGFIAGDLAEKWKEKAQERMDVKNLVEKAEQGDAGSMWNLGDRYYHGKQGLPKDLEKAYVWFQKARKAGSVTAIAFVGSMLLKGEGVAQDERTGMMYVTEAATKGSRWASNRLGIAWSRGDWGLPVNKTEAVRWFRFCLTEGCATHDVEDSEMEHVKGRLLKLLHNLN